MGFQVFFFFSSKKEKEYVVLRGRKKNEIQKIFRWTKVKTTGNFSWWALTKNNNNYEFIAIINGNNFDLQQQLNFDAFLRWVRAGGGLSFNKELSFPEKNDVYIFLVLRERRDEDVGSAKKKNLWILNLITSLKIFIRVFSFFFLFEKKISPKGSKWSLFTKKKWKIKKCVWRFKNHLKITFTSDH